MSASNENVDKQKNTLVRLDMKASVVLLRRDVVVVVGESDGMNQKKRKK